MSDSKRTAACCCGKMAVETSGAPVLSVLCHCGDCRRRTGSPFAWSAYFPEMCVALIRGAPRLYQPDGAHFLARQFCGDCGSTLSWRDYRMPGHVGVAAGGLEPAVDSPGLSNQDGDRCVWVTLPASCETKPRQRSGSTE